MAVDAAAREALARDIAGTGVTLEALAHEALAAREFAFVPHSGFKVGCAVLSANGRVFRGANVESAAYPLTNCAERVAIQKAVSEGERQVLAVAVAADATYLRKGPPGAGKAATSGAGAASGGAGKAASGGAGAASGGAGAGAGAGAPGGAGQVPGAPGQAPPPSGLDLFVTPCGACRQIIFEFGPDAPVVLVDLEGGRYLTSARELLPGGFRLEGFER